jgi:stage III sporulation protein AD
MDTLFRMIGAAVIGLALTVIVKKNTPEIGLLLGVFVAIAVLTAGLDAFRSVKDFLDSVLGETGVPRELAAPVWKTCVIAVITKITAELCRDAKESAAASAVETAGAVLGLYAALPLFAALFDLTRVLL